MNVTRIRTTLPWLSIISLALTLATTFPADAAQPGLIEGAQGDRGKAGTEDDEEFEHGRWAGEPQGEATPGWKRCTEIRKGGA